MGDLRVDAEVWPVRWPDGQLKGGAGLVGGANSCERDDWPQALMSKRAQPAGVIVEEMREVVEVAMWTRPRRVRGQKADRGK